MGTTKKLYETPSIRVHEIAPFRPLCDSSQGGYTTNDGNENYTTESTSNWF